MPGWQTLSSKVVYENPWMAVHEDHVTRPDGNQGIYGFVESKCPGVYVVPIDKEGYTYLVQQYRYTTGGKTWECVAGRTDGEKPEDAAHRELLEETGLRAKDLIHMASIRPVPGMTVFEVEYYIATGLSRQTTEIDEAEGITQTRRIPLTDAVAMIRGGEITCSDSIAALYMAKDLWDTKYSKELTR